MNHSEFGWKNNKNIKLEVKMYKFKIKFLFIFLLCVLIAWLSFANFMVLNIFVFAEASSKNYEQEEIICAATIDDNFDEDSVLVVLDSEISGINKLHSANFFKGIDVESIEDLTSRKNNISIEITEFKQILQINLKNSTKEKVLNSIKELERLKGVYSAEPNYFSEPTTVPNDVYYANGSQWNLNGTGGINAEMAWNYSHGNNDIRVGIIDTGIANHDDLNDNLVSGYDFFNNDTITNDDTNGHGTKVAGIIGAQGNNNEGIAGINWDITLVPLQASNKKNSFYSSDAIKAIQWAQSKWGTSQQIDIINYSVAGFGVSTSLLESIKAYEGLFVWAAGNDGNNVDSFVDIEKFNLDNLISVGAIDKNNERSVWGTQSSNYGENVNIFAPGGYGFSNVLPGDNIPTTDNYGNYSKFSGTSCAAPHVTGVAALILSVNPNLSAGQLKNILLDNSDNINITVPNSLGGTSLQTVKKLNAYKAVKSVHRHTYKYFDFKGKHTGVCECGDSYTEGHQVSAASTGRYVTCIVCGATVDTNKYPVIIVPFYDSVSQLSTESTVISTKYQLQEYLNGARTVLTSEQTGAIIEYYDEKFFAEYSIMFGDIDFNEVSYWLLKNSLGWQAE